MFKTNYHNHSKWSDGKYNPEKTVLRAIELGFDIIGFSDHSPVPFKSEWNMKYENLLKYISDINNLKEKYNEQIKIYLGLEADFINGISYIKNFKHLGLDYTIGGAHYLPETFEDGTIFNIDNTDEIFQRGLSELYNNDIKFLVERYYNAVNQMIEEDSPDVIAHLDLIEKFNKNHKYFDSKAQWYQKIVDNCLKTIQKTNCIVELNSRSLYKGLLDDFSPKITILQKMLNLKIPVTISGDVHNPEEMELFWKKSIENLKFAGYKEMMLFDQNKWQIQKID
ncbi:MAG: histidinol-phosphatase [Bacteroidales bacterium]|nr:histidinol-phosphatase [Bacteroidales bacterium]